MSDIGFFATGCIGSSRGALRWQSHWVIYLLYIVGDVRISESKSRINMEVPFLQIWLLCLDCGDTCPCSFEYYPNDHWTTTNLGYAFLYIRATYVNRYLLYIYMSGCSFIDVGSVENYANTTSDIFSKHFKVEKNMIAQQSLRHWAPLDEDFFALLSANTKVAINRNKAPIFRHISKLWVLVVGQIDVCNMPQTRTSHDGARSRRWMAAWNC